MLAGSSALPSEILAGHEQRTAGCEQAVGAHCLPAVGARAAANSSELHSSRSLRPGHRGRRRRTVCPKRNRRSSRPRSLANPSRAECCVAARDGRTVRSALACREEVKTRCLPTGGECHLVTLRGRRRKYRTPWSAEGFENGPPGTRGVYFIPAVSRRPPSCPPARPNR